MNAPELTEHNLATSHKRLISISIVFADLKNSLTVVVVNRDKKLEYEGISKEIETIFNQIENINLLNENKKLYIKENITTDIIRKKIIE